MTINPLVSSVLQHIAGGPEQAGAAQGPRGGAAPAGGALGDVRKMLDALMNASRMIAGNVPSQPAAFCCAGIDPKVQANPRQSLKAANQETSSDAAAKTSGESQLDDTEKSDGSMKDKAGNTIPEGWTQKKWDDFKQLIHAGSVDIMNKYYDKALAALPRLNRRSMKDLKQQELQAIAILGLRAYEQGKNRDARLLFEGLISLDPSLYYGYAGLGAIALQEGNLEEAVTQLALAAERNPTDPSVRANLGEALLRMSRFEEATEQFRAALDLDPGGRDPGANRARAILNGIEVVMRQNS